MFKYIVKRILLLIPIFLISSVIIFLLVKMAPGDPAIAMTGGARTTEEMLENIRVKYHLNDPLITQYGYWIKGVFQGDLGTSYKLKESVITLLVERLPVTLELVVMSMGIGIVFSIPIGIIGAVKRNTGTEKVLSVFSTVCMSTPIFFSAILFMLLLAYKLRLFPTNGIGKNAIENIRYLFIPALALGLNMVAMNARILKNSMVEALDSSYIQTAIAKGISTKRIILKHALKNAMVPFITMTGIELGTMIGSSAVVEEIFGIGGVGKLLINGVLSSDFPVIQGVTLFIVILFLLINLVVDISCTLIDRRIQLK